jgi:hypothetical protein
MTVYNTNLSTSAVGLSVDLPIAPPVVRIIKPVEVITASGLRKLLGKEGRELLWNITNITDLKAITDRTGGTAASSIPAFLRCEDTVPRSSTVPTYSDWSGFADQPQEGEFRQGPNRYNVRVTFRRMTLVQQLTP